MVDPEAREVLRNALIKLFKRQTSLEDYAKLIPEFLRARANVPMSEPRSYMQLTRDAVIGEIDSWICSLYYLEEELEYVSFDDLVEEDQEALLRALVFLESDRVYESMNRGCLIESMFPVFTGQNRRLGESKWWPFATFEDYEDALEKIVNPRHHFLKNGHG